jgi:cyclopropane fatty-acyl-phospholipid synthase-like methyltransferase
MSRFSKQSELYASYRPDYPDEMYALIFDNLQSFSCAWDCATGTGQVAKVLAKRFDRVIGSDISKAQMSHAPELKNVTYHQAVAEDSGFATRKFDLVTVGQALHWFDFQQFYNEVRRVTANQALFAAFGYGMLRINNNLNEITDALYEEVFGEYFSKNRSYIDNEYEDIPFPFELIPTPSFEQNYRWSIEQLEGYFNSWSAVQRIKDDRGYNPVDSTMEKLKANHSAESKIDVTFPIFLRLGRV